jgi:hypothetical protein
MFSEFYSQNPLLFWPLVGLAIFVVSFGAVLLYVLIGLRDKAKVDYLAALPLEPDSELSVDSREAGVAGGRA